MEPLDFQKPAMAEIVARARAYFSFHKGHGRYRDIRDSGFQPRWPIILVAPTGVGKSTSAQMVASHPDVRASMCRITAPAYMPLGAHNRGSKESITIIAEHVASNHRTLLVLDEIDKINDQDNAWHGYIRNEIMDLVGKTFPTGLKIPEIDDQPEITIEELNEKLRTTVFILGIGTFQDWFDSERARRTIGFGSGFDGADQEKDKITADIIAQKLPRELINRFGKIVLMPELQENDYRQIAREAENKLPESIRESFRDEVSKRILEAIDAKKGVRFLEEALTAVLLTLPEPTPSKYLMLDDL